MESLEVLFKRALLRILAKHPCQGRLWAAYSGGMDSHVLLRLIASLQSLLSPLQLCALHVHHGLQEDANHWVAHCRQICGDLNIPCTIVYGNARPHPGESPEAAARRIRYAAFHQYLGHGEMMLSAQHGDDQAETLLLQLLRGAGPAGLAAMPECAPLGQAWLARPLLAFSRTQLQDYAQQQQLKWVEDITNLDTRFDRNFLRHEVISRLKERWPSLHRTLTRAAAHQAESLVLLQTTGDQDWRRCRTSPPKIIAGLYPNMSPLSVRSIMQFSPVRQRNLLRSWLCAHAVSPPSQVQMEHILKDGISLKADRHPVIVWAGGMVRRYRDKLFTFPSFPPPPSKTPLPWEPSAILTLSLGCLQARRKIGQGLKIPRSANLTIRFRQGGETCKRRGVQHILKSLFQAVDTPPWLRDFVPLVFIDENFAAAPGIGVCDDFAATGKEEGWEITWRQKKIQTGN